MAYRGRGRGGGGRGRGRGGGYGGVNFSQDSSTKRPRMEDSARTSTSLAQSLTTLQGAPYPAYKDLLGSWGFSDPAFTLFIDHVQADPYAPPSKVRVRVPHSAAGFDASLYSNKIRKTALADFLHRCLWKECNAKGYDAVKGAGGGWAGSKGGDVQIDAPTAQVLERTALIVTDEFIEARIGCALPAKGRSIQGHEASALLCQRVPQLARTALYAAALETGAVRKHVECVEDQDALRAALPKHELVAFVRNGAVLPRASGASSKPLTGPDVIPFQSPLSLAVTINTPNSGPITGLGIPARSLVVVIGAGFHGKSTLLESVRLGCYDYQPGDGREFVSAVADVTSIQSEDGRQISAVDVSHFIHDLPGRSAGSTRCFSTTNASGSTSCSAATLESLEVGSKLLCIDEDTTASNWLSCAAAMSELVGRETIRPLEDRAKPLVMSCGATLLLACGSNLGFLGRADVVVKMDNFRCYDVTKEAREVGTRASEGSDVKSTGAFKAAVPRAWEVAALREKVAGKVMARGTHAIRLGGGGRGKSEDDEDQVEVRALPQVICESQTRGIIAALKYLASQQGEGGSERDTSIASTVVALEGAMDRRLDEVMQP
ncbi:hypothetical protein BDZ90DRAFT_231611, partial [Jaminaea rosea]